MTLCVGPVCDGVCAECVGAAAAAAGTTDVPLDDLRRACGEENACLCAQCLESGLLTQAADPTRPGDGADPTNGDQSVGGQGTGAR